MQLKRRDLFDPVLRWLLKTFLTWTSLFCTCMWSIVHPCTTSNMQHWGLIGLWRVSEVSLAMSLFNAFVSRCHLGMCFTHMANSLYLTSLPAQLDNTGCACTCRWSPHDLCTSPIHYQASVAYVARQPFCVDSTYQMTIWLCETTIKLIW